MEITRNLEDRGEVLELGKVRGKTLLDIGAGPLAVIAARDFSCDVTSIDVSDEALQKAREEAEKEHINIDFEREDATDLSYGDNSFDVVISYAALHHVSSLKARKNFVKEAYIVAPAHAFPYPDDNVEAFRNAAIEYGGIPEKWRNKFEVEKTDVEV